MSFERQYATAYWWSIAT